ncbi:MAG TPA: ABC transporter permease [Candidatus Humimicrobiaceae bacterium]
MRSLSRLTVVQMKLYLREPMAAFFTIAWAPMILLLFGFIYGNEPTPFFGGLGFVDSQLPAYMGIIIVTVGMMSVPISTSEDRERGVLKRFHSTPMSPAIYLFANVFTYFIMSFIGVTLLFLLGKFVYHAQFEGNIFSVLAGFTISALSFFSFGYLIASLSPTARVANAVGMVFGFIMMFLSGAAIPVEVMGDKVANISKYLPLTYVVSFLKGLWVGDSWGSHWLDLTVILGLLVVGAILSTVTFKWE